jgi:hypothetical protein
MIRWDYPGNTKGDLLFDRFGISCMTTDIFLQNRLIQPVKQEVNCIVILPPQVFPGSTLHTPLYIRQKGHIHYLKGNLTKNRRNINCFKYIHSSCPIIFTNKSLWCKYAYKQNTCTHTHIHTHSSSVFRLVNYLSKSYCSNGPKTFVSLKRFKICLAKSMPSRDRELKIEKSHFDFVASTFKNQVIHFLWHVHRCKASPSPICTHIDCKAFHLCTYHKK